MPKRPKFCCSAFSSSSSHFLFPRDLSGTIADTDITNTPLEPLRPTDVPFGGYKTETKDLEGILAANRFFGCTRAIQRMKIKIGLTV